MRFRHKQMGMGYLALSLVCWVSLFGVALAEQERDMSSGVPKPAIPMGQGQTCVADTDFMRRNHMDMLTHQRDETVLEGLRGDAFSLKDCINCHVVKGADAKAVTVADPKHFCRSCHDYAAVSIDCFQCHASRPEAVDFADEHQFSNAAAGTANQSGSN